MGVGVFPGSVFSSGDVRQPLGIRLRFQTINKIFEDVEEFAEPEASVLT